MQTALRDDALTSSDEGFSLRVGLPWIRSLPVACVHDPSVTVDGEPADGLTVVIDGRAIAPTGLLDEDAWWFAQDRLLLRSRRRLAPGGHDVVVEFGLLVPYLMAGPGGGPLQLPMRISARLELDHPPVPSVSLDVA